MTDRPIIFSAAMVRALLGGRKNQTRRVLKPQPDLTDEDRVRCVEYKGQVYSGNTRIPYAPGDRLYVREAMHWTDNLRFVADDAVVDFDRMPQGFTAGRPHVSGMFMPRWASRITLTVTEVRVQRLQEISEADAVAEGILRTATGHFDYHEHAEIRFTSAVGAYRELWNSLHGPDAWDANPWVVAVSFIPHLTNIDAPYLEMTGMTGNFIARNIPVGTNGKLPCPVIPHRVALRS